MNRVIVAPGLVRALSWIFPVLAIAVWPVVLARRPLSAVAARHESIHLVQQAEVALAVLAPLVALLAALAALGLLGPVSGPVACAVAVLAAALAYPVLYVAQWLHGVGRGLSDVQAYRAISFEVEAFGFEGVAGYVTTRPPFAWWGAAPPRTPPQLARGLGWSNPDGSAWYAPGEAKPVVWRWGDFWFTDLTDEDGKLRTVKIAATPDQAAKIAMALHEASR